MNDPEFANVVLKLAPGAIVPELQAPPSAVDVCAVLSLFVHVTVLPRATEIGFGLYAVVVNVLEPETIETDIPFGDGVVGDLGLSLPPHPATKSKDRRRAERTIVTRIVIPLC